MKQLWLILLFAVVLITVNTSIAQDLPESNDLALNLVADIGVTVEAGNMETALTNQAPSPKNTTIAKAASPTEMVIFKRDGLLIDTDEKKDDGFFLDQPPSENGNWVTPVNYRDGKLYFKILIREVVTEIPNMVVKWNIWQDGERENTTLRYECPAIPGSMVEFSSNTHIGLWQKPTPLDYTVPRKMYGIHFLLGTEGPLVGLLKGHKWGRGKYTRDQIFPMDVKIMVVAVAKDVAFSGWENYWNED